MAKISDVVFFPVVFVGDEEQPVVFDEAEKIRLYNGLYRILVEAVNWYAVHFGDMSGFTWPAVGQFNLSGPPLQLEIPKPWPQVRTRWPAQVFSAPAESQPLIGRDGRQRMAGGDLHVRAVRTDGWLRVFDAPAMWVRARDCKNLGAG